MEVKVESTGTVDAPEAYDPQSGKFTWTIKDFSRRRRKLYSDSFQVGSYRWRILVFPKGNNVDRLSVYLNVADSRLLSYGWSGYAQFSLTVVNQLHNKFSIRKEASHQFNARESDWGFTNFMPLSEMLDPSRGYVVNDTCVVEADVSVSLVRLKKEQEEEEQNRKRKRKVNTAAHLYTIVKVARDVDLFKQIGEDIFFDLVDHDKVRSFRIQNQLPFIDFKEKVAKELGVPVQYQRFWLWATRRNNTYRPHRPVTPQEESQPVGQLREVSNKANSAELKLFLEMEIGQDFRPIALPEKSTKDLLLFFKLYDPSNEEFRFLRYIGRFYVSALGKPMDILTRLNEMAGFARDEEIELFEEIKFEPEVMCELIDKKSTFLANELEDGDIICFQKTPKVGTVKQIRYPDVPSFLEYVHKRQAEIDRNIIEKSEAGIVETDSSSKDKPHVSPSNCAQETEDLILEELMKVTSETDIEDKGLSDPVNKSIHLETVQEQIPHQTSSQTSVEKPKLLMEAKKAAKWMIEILGQTDDDMVNENEINAKLSIITSCFIENRFPSHYIKQAETFPTIIQNLFKRRDKIRVLKNQTAKLEEETKELYETEEKMKKRCLRYEEILQDASSKLEILKKKEKELETELASIRQKIAENIERREKLEKPFIKSQAAKKELDEELSKVISDKHEKQKTLEVSKHAEIEESCAFEKALEGKTKLKLIFEQLLAEYSD
ncbi:hypothetical protein PIB30_022032 [Stylosanthes scabra]|uniref:MATH domain-containing protein n=1 Tax=Stylosanthes scabra TaxID=79078 RepID=A0ABU6Y929_9FABA|nr:hypothetical protein [Stylosanthes scabra]